MQRATIIAILKVRLGLPGVGHGLVPHDCQIAVEPEIQGVYAVQVGFRGFNGRDLVCLDQP